MNYFYKYFLLLLGLSYIEGRKGFRCDYEYSEIAYGWFKFHAIPAIWADARLRCMLERGELASPTSQEMILEMQRLMDTGHTTKVFTGINSFFSAGDFHTISGIRLSDLKLTFSEDPPYNLNSSHSCITFDLDGKIQYALCDSVRHYFCFRSANIRTEPNVCGSVDSEYHLDRKTGKCYKFHVNPRNFSRAFFACSAEGGNLVIIKTDEEHTMLKALYLKSKPHLVGANIEDGQAYVGFHSWNEKWDWRTLHNQRPWEAGYGRFKSGHPDNWVKDEHCGTLHFGGLLGDYNCDAKPAPFICEKKPNYPPVCKVPSRSGKQKQLKPKQRQLQKKKRQLQPKQSQLQKKKMSERKSKIYEHHF